MGQSISDIRKTAEQNDNEQKQELMERLQMLEKLIHQRLENQKNHILNGEKNDQEIDTGTIVSLHKMVFVKESKGANSKVSEAISKIFSGDLIGGLESIVQLGAEAVIANQSMGEYETTDMFIVWNENALLRCDAYYYRWNFVSDGVLTATEGVTGVLLVKRVINLATTDPQVLTWAITNMADRLNSADPKPEKPANPQELIEQAMRVLEKVLAFQTKVKAIEAGGQPSTSKNSDAV